MISAIEELAVMLVLLTEDHPEIVESPADMMVRMAGRPFFDLASAPSGETARILRSRTVIVLVHLVGKTIRIACADGWDPDDLVHPDGLEALALYMYCVATGTWDRPIPALPMPDSHALNITGARQAWRWRQILTKATTLISKHK